MNLQLMLTVTVAGICIATGALLGYSAGLPMGELRGRAALQQEIQVAGTAIELEREKADAAQSKLSDHDFCVAALGARGLPVDSCAVLHGFPSE